MNDNAKKTRLSKAIIIFFNIKRPSKLIVNGNRLSKKVLVQVYVEEAVKLGFEKNL